jgi:uncharacterized protein YkwD
MKRKKVLMIVLALLIFLFTVIPMGTAQLKVDASEAYQKVESGAGIVTAADVNLRNGPATTFDIICKLKKDQKVAVIGKLGSWYAVYVSSSGNIGAISAQYLKIDKAKATTTNTKATSSKNSQSIPKAVVKTGTKATAAKNSQSIPKATVKTSARDTSSAAANTATTASKVKNISSDEQALLDLVNKVRKEKDLQALEFDVGLVKVARLKANDMKDNSYFSHTSKFYGTPFDMMKKYDIKFSAAGENIAGNQSIEKVNNGFSLNKKKIRFS